MIARGIVVLITAYRRWLSPLLGQRCRFAPSCSAYTVEAVESFGAVRGLWLAGRIRPITSEHEISTNEAIVTAAEAMYDGMEPVVCEHA